MKTEITVPRLGWTMEEGTFVGWLKQEGDFVKAGEPLFTLDGDKALQEVEATESGILHIADNAPTAGTLVRVGDLLGYLVQSNDQADKSSTARTSLDSSQPARLPRAVAGGPSDDSWNLPGTAERQPECAPVSKADHAAELRASPRARRRAKELGVNWATLTGSGRGGRIRERDVLAAAQNKSAG